MSNTEIKLDSGAILNITMASFTDGNRLFKAVTKELEGLDLKEDTVQKMAFKLMSSNEVEKALWICMERATYNQVKLTSNVFEDATARGDYLNVAKEVMVFNLTPFLKGLDSVFAGILPKSTIVPK